MYMCGAKERVAPLFDDDSRMKWPALNCECPYKITNVLATLLAPQFQFGDHLVDWYLSLLDTLMKVPISNREIEFWYLPIDMHRAKTFLFGKTDPIYALNMGGRQGSKCYPPEKYADFVKMILQEEPDANFVILGGGEEDEKSVEIFKQRLGEKLFNRNVSNGVGKLTYQQSAALLKFCKIYIGNDTGTMHIAAAMKCPVLGVFSFPADLPQSPFDTVRMYRPYHVPNVVIQPEKSLPECAEQKIYMIYGCKENFPHCIAQIEPETIFKGFHLLKERIEQGLTETLYLS